MFRPLEMGGGYERLVPRVAGSLRKAWEASLPSSLGTNPGPGSLEPVAGLGTLLVQLCQEAVVISKEIGNSEKMGMWVGISHSSWGLYMSSVGRPQCTLGRPRISCLYVCIIFLMLLSSFDLPKGRGVSLSSGTRMRCPSPPSSSGLLQAFPQLQLQWPGVTQMGEEQIHPSDWCPC